MPTVDAILMASGSSERFGNSKLLASFHGQPLAAHTLALATSMPEISRVWFVCAQPDVAALAAKTPATVIHNSCPERGACESIRLGVQASAAQHYLFLTCDQPLLDATTLRALLAHSAPGRIVVPQHNGLPAMPSLFSASFRTALLSLQDGQNARLIKQQHPAAVLHVPISSPWPLFDVDTPQDLTHLQQKFPLPLHISNH